MPPSPRRSDVTSTELIGGIEKRNLVIVDHDPAWSQIYRNHEERIRAALPESTVVALEHIGSTSVAGLAAKPIIDILLVVPDITAEEDYLPHLINSGYVLRVREPAHRMVRTPQLDVHVHILQDDDPAVGDYLVLRDHLLRHEGDRELYAQTKRDLVAHDWPDMNAYAEAKTAVITEIKQRARKDQ